MKKISFIITTMMFFILVQANSKILVIRGHDRPAKGSTEVLLNSPDSIELIPSQETAYIQLAVKNVSDDILSYRILPVNEDVEVELTIPDILDGYLIEIRDDKSVVYTEIN